MSFLLNVHPWLGYVVTVVFIAVIVMAGLRARDAKEFSAGPFVGAMILLDIHVLLGLILYGAGGYYDGAGAMVAYVHPVLALAALAIGHITLRRARNEQMAVASHRKVVRGFLVTLVLIIAAIGVASAPVG